MITLGEMALWKICKDCFRVRLSSDYFYFYYLMAWQVEKQHLAKQRSGISVRTAASYSLVSLGPPQALLLLIRTPRGPTIYTE